MFSGTCNDRQVQATRLTKTALSFSLAGLTLECKFCFFGESTKLLIGSLKGTIK